MDLSYFSFHRGDALSADIRRARAARVLGVVPRERLGNTPKFGFLPPSKQEADVRFLPPDSHAAARTRNHR